MKRGNVLVIGNSGVGKSTLINAVLGDNQAKTGWGTKGTTEKLEIYESDSIPFRIIDSIGFEPTFFKEKKAINAVKKWSSEHAKDDNSDNDINVIWFCVEGTSSKLFPKAIESLAKATAMWKSIPIIVVITKSYSVPEREKNIQMVKMAFEKQKRKKNLEKIIPVVAQTYELNETAFAAPEGIMELIDATNDVMPKGIKAGAEDVAAFKLSRKRALAQGIVGTSTAAGVVVGAVPVPFSDAAILSPVEIAEVNAIATLYGIKKNESTKRFLKAIVEVGTVGAAAKAAIGAIKLIPGLQLAGSVINAVVAGSIVATLGEGAVYVFEQVYVGKKTTDDIDWLKKILEAKFTDSFIKKVSDILNKISENPSRDEILDAIQELFSDTFKAAK